MSAWAVEPQLRKACGSLGPVFTAGLRYPA